MPLRLLHVDASPRAERSNSRALAKTFLDAWRREHRDGVVVHRPVGVAPPPHVSEAWIVGAFAPPEYHTPEAKAAIAVSDALIEEFLAADVVLVSTPMHNLSLPSTLKAYIDHVVRIGKTFKIHANGTYEGLATGKKLIVLTTSGAAYGVGTPFASHNFLDPYLRTIFAFIGVRDVTFVNAELMDAGDDHKSASLKRAEAQLVGLAQRDGHASRVLEIPVVE